MGLTSKKILGVTIHLDKREIVLEEVRKYLGKPKVKRAKINVCDIKPLVIFTPNPEIIVYAQKDPKFKQLVNSAQINIPDGYGDVWALKKTYRLEMERLSGSDFMLDLCRLAAERGFTVGLIGGEGGVAVRVAECLRLRYPGLKIGVVDAPEIVWEERKGELQLAGKKNFEKERYFCNLVETLERKKISLLFVALGFPKQEFFIHLLRKQLIIDNYQLPIILMAVGGAFDYLSGKPGRAPLWLQYLGLEWLYRLVRQPWRLFRQLKGGKFFYLVLIRLRGNPRS